MPPRPTSARDEFVFSINEIIRRAKSKSKVAVTIKNFSQVSHVMQISRLCLVELFRHEAARALLIFSAFFFFTLQDASGVSYNVAARLKKLRLNSH